MPSTPATTELKPVMANERLYWAGEMGVLYSASAPSSEAKVLVILISPVSTMVTITPRLAASPPQGKRANRALPAGASAREWPGDQRRKSIQPTIMPIKRAKL